MSKYGRREALAGYRLLENKNSQSKALVNIADEDRRSGTCVRRCNFTGESLELDREDTGHTAIAGYNIAIVHQLHGDLPGAKQGLEQSLAIWQRTAIKLPRLTRSGA